MLSIFGCPVKIYNNKETALLNVRNNETNEIEKIKLYDYVQKNCPSLIGEKAYYYPTPWIGNGHAQTAYAAYQNFEGIHLIDYERKFVSTSDGGQIAVDWTPPVSNKPFDNTPTIIVLHGLTGGSHESYIRCLLEILVNPPYNYRAVVINFRGCAESDITSPRLYSAGVTDDIRPVISYIKKCIPNAPLLGIGFSMGANMLIKYLGEEGERTPLFAAASVANPFDLIGGTRSLERTYIGKYVYSPTMANNLKKALARHEHIMKEDKRLDLEYAKSAFTLREFDARLTAISFGYETVDHYYRDASSSQYITKVKIPLLCLNAEDDPVASHECIPFDECIYNPNIILATTYYGGHLGWFTGWWQPTRWCIKPLSEWCIALLKTCKNPNNKSFLNDDENNLSEEETVFDEN
ncbi:3830_t:CDS:2 [Funneliformis mosseae]|uniref:3830_t:CDS:1 n=1 Tax=Funneliformis mosseae TaxID=27381 RepID=A0A9N9CWB7_FUNMO|nr:3830_t:CDS:2 [Funneliformis mosseae]